jgi:hypothetical protein
MGINRSKTDKKTLDFQSRLKFKSVLSHFVKIFEIYNTEFLYYSKYEIYLSFFGLIADNFSLNVLFLKYYHRKWNKKEPDPHKGPGSRRIFLGLRFRVR